MDSPQIVTLIPTYRRPKMLRRTLASVLAQTHTNFEAWVFDDNSQDETETVVKEFGDPRIRYFRHPENIGMIRNFDFGLHLLKAPFFSFLSDDDVLLPTFYETSLACFQQSPTAMMVSGVTWVVDERGGVLSGEPLELPAGLYAPPEGLHAMLDHRYPDWQGCMFRREVIDVVGTIDPESRVSDYDYVLRVASVCPVLVHHEAVALFAHHAGSSTADLKHDFIYPSFLITARSLARDERIPEESRRYAERMITQDLTRRLRLIGLKRLIAGDIATATQVGTILRDELNAEKEAADVLRLTSAARGVPLIASAARMALGVRRKLRHDAQVRRYDLPSYAKEMALPPRMPPGGSSAR